MRGTRWAIIFTVLRWTSCLLAHRALASLRYNNHTHKRHFYYLQNLRRKLAQSANLIIGRLIVWVLTSIIGAKYDQFAYNFNNICCYYLVPWLRRGNWQFAIIAAPIDRRYLSKNYWIWPYLCLVLRNNNMQQIITVGHKFGRKISFILNMCPERFYRTKSRVLFCRLQANKSIFSNIFIVRFPIL